MVPEGIKRLKPQLINSLNRGVRIITYGKNKKKQLYFSMKNNSYYLYFIFLVFSIPELTPIEVRDFTYENIISYINIFNCFCCDRFNYIKVLLKFIYIPKIQYEIILSN